MKNLHYTVSQLISKTRRVLELSFKGIWVDGEISNVHYHSSGHIYFTLKDASSELRCAMFKSANRFLRFQLEDGMRIMIYGSLSIFESRGQIHHLYLLYRQAFYSNPVHTTDEDRQYSF